MYVQKRPNDSMNIVEFVLTKRVKANKERYTHCDTYSIFTECERITVSLRSSLETYGPGMSSFLPENLVRTIRSTICFSSRLNLLRKWPSSSLVASNSSIDRGEKYILQNGKPVELYICDYEGQVIRVRVT